MLKTARLKAEEQFAATQRKAKKALNEKEKAWRSSDPSAWPRRRPTRKPPSRPAPGKRPTRTKPHRVLPRLYQMLI
jgi:hypothetical protein